MTYTEQFFQACEDAFTQGNHVVLVKVGTLVYSEFEKDITGHITTFRADGGSIYGIVNPITREYVPVVREENGTFTIDVKPFPHKETTENNVPLERKKVVAATSVGTVYNFVLKSPEEAVL